MDPPPPPPWTYFTAKVDPHGTPSGNNYMDHTPGTKYNFVKEKGPLELISLQHLDPL